MLDPPGGSLLKARGPAGCKASPKGPGRGCVPSIPPCHPGLGADADPTRPLAPRQPSGRQAMQRLGSAGCRGCLSYMSRAAAGGGQRFISLVEKTSSPQRQGCVSPGRGSRTDSELQPKSCSPSGSPISVALRPLGSAPQGPGWAGRGRTGQVHWAEPHASSPGAKKGDEHTSLRVKAEAGMQRPRPGRTEAQHWRGHLRRHPIATHFPHQCELGPRPASGV